MRCTFIIAWAGNNYSAHVPDLPGCIATGTTLEDVKRSMQEAIEFHLERMRLHGYPIPERSTQIAYADVT